MVFYSARYNEVKRSVVNSDSIAIPENARLTNVKPNNGFTFKNERDANSETVNVAGGAAPVAAFTTDTVSGAAPLAVAFTNTSSDIDTANLTYIWHFGDGGISTSASPSHTYASAGTYVALLTVTDGTTSSYANVTITAS